MLELRSVEQLSFLFKVIENQRVCFLHENSGVGSLGSEITL